MNKPNLLVIIKIIIYINIQTCFISEFITIVRIILFWLLSPACGTNVCTIINQLSGAWHKKRRKKLQEISYFRDNKKFCILINGYVQDKLLIFTCKRSYRFASIIFNVIILQTFNTSNNYINHYILLNKTIISLYCLSKNECRVVHTYLLCIIWDLLRHFNWNLFIRSICIWI